MAEAAYTARVTTKDHVAAEVTKLHLSTTNGQFTHDAASQFVLGLNRVLQGTFNPSSGQGMSKLLRSSTDPTNPSAISAIKTTDFATITTILKASVREARENQRTSATPDVHIPPAIEGRADAIDAADRENILNQLVIGAKEGITDAVNTKVDTRVTNSVLRTADGTTTSPLTSTSSTRSSPPSSRPPSAPASAASAGRSSTPSQCGSTSYSELRTMWLSFEPRWLTSRRMASPSPSR